MMNPFVSVDQQLENIGWIKQYEGDKGFTFAKKIGVECFYVAESRNGRVCFYDGTVFCDYYAVAANEKELLLFSKKLKEWKGQYESKNNN